MKSVFLIYFICLTPFIFCQNLLNGTVVDERNVPIPFAEVYVKGSAESRSAADVNGYFEMRLINGEYFLVVSASGYEDRDNYVTIADHDVTKEFQLFPVDVKELTEFTVSVKKSNPGREIMLHVVEKRDQINFWNYEHSCEGYIKATEKLNFKAKSEKELAKEDKKKEKDTRKNPPTHIPTEEEILFDEDQKKINLLASSMNLVEVQFTRNYAHPNKVKETRNAYEARGVVQNLYYTTTVKSNFNFFENLLHLDDLHQTPVSSPISTPGILSYKYKLVEQYEEDGKKIHKIKISPRSSATSTLEGYIWIVDSTWMVQKLELTMSKGNLLVYDYFKIEQDFDHFGDTLCVLNNQVLTYGVKYKNQTSSCSTSANFSKYNFNPKFAPKFFNKELSITEKEAYDKDTSYWNKVREVSLTKEEQRYIITKDSIRDFQNRTEYLDSIDRIFNKVTAAKIFWFGIDHRNRLKRTQWTIGSVATFLRPIYIAGPRLAPSFNFYKKWENQRYIDSYSEISIGLLNKDVKGRTYWKYLFDPFHFGSVSASFMHEFDAIRSFDAITQIYKRNNFIESTQARVSLDREIFNGFYVNPELNFSERRNINQYKFVNALDSVLNNDNPTVFEQYQACIASLTLSYVPGQKFMREPNRKVLLGSRWPTLYVQYEKGIPKLFGSDVNHDYGLFGVMQTFKIFTLGTSSYHVKSGQFLSSKSLKDADFKYNRRSDPIWFSNPLYSFQGLNQSLPSKEFFIEGHIVHHDNGAILNKIPFMKKTGIGLVVGCGGLYVHEFKWQHYEFFSGLERNFKFSKRKLRIGVYGVLSDGNNLNPTTTWKVSFAVLDLRNMKWNF